MAYTDPWTFGAGGIPAPSIYPTEPWEAPQPYPSRFQTFVIHIPADPPPTPRASENPFNSVWLDQ